MRRFQSTVKHYVAGRVPYAPRLIALVAKRCRLRPSHRVLDLGCGPGPLAIAFSRFAGAVVALDPEPEMLQAARAAAAEAGAPIAFLEASAADLGPDLGHFRMVTIGRAFHWMDRADTLARLDRIVDPGGAIVLFHDHHLDVPGNRWEGEYRALLARYAQGDEAWTRRRTPEWVPHEAILLASPFNRLERLGVIERRRVDIDRLVHRALSMSSTSPQRLGSRAQALGREIRALMQGYAIDGMITEIVESQALIARRGRASSRGRLAAQTAPPETQSTAAEGGLPDGPRPRGDTDGTGL
jgi:SAM-dependent methyltransferase